MVNIYLALWESLNSKVAPPRRLVISAEDHEHALELLIDQINEDDIDIDNYILEVENEADLEDDDDEDDEEGDILITINN